MDILKAGKVRSFLLPLIVLATLWPTAILAEEPPTEEPAPTSPRQVLWTTYQGIIGTVSAKYLVDAVDEASLIGAECLVIELDTPGGLDTSMRTIVKAILGVSDRVIVLNMGEKIAEGVPQEIVHHPEVIRVFLGKAHA